MGTIKGTYAYTFNSDSIDGIIEVTVSASDYAGHESARKTYTVIRSCASSGEKTPYISNKASPFEGEPPEWWFKGDSAYQKAGMLYNNYAKNYLLVTGLIKTEWITFAGTIYYYYPTDCEISLKAGVKAGIYDIELPVVEFADYNDTTVYAVNKSSLSADLGYYLELKVTEPSGYVYTLNQFLPPTPRLVKIEKDENRPIYSIHTSFPFNENVNVKALIFEGSENSKPSDLLETRTGSLKHKTSASSEITTGYLSADKKYYFALVCGSEDWLVSSLSAVYELKETEIASTKLDCPSYTYT